MRCSEFQQRVKTWRGGCASCCNGWFRWQRWDQDGHGCRRARATRPRVLPQRLSGCAGTVRASESGSRHPLGWLGGSSALDAAACGQSAVGMGWRMVPVGSFGSSAGMCRHSVA